MNLFSPFF